MLSPGDVLFGKYRIEKRLGAGSFGEVFRAKEELLDRQVAIKQLRRAEETQLEEQNAITEAKLLAKLDHPNIIRLNGLEVDEHFIYMVMEFARGDTLRKAIQQKGKFSEDDALTVVRQIAEGLEHAHNLGVMHRDLKPENIFSHAGHYKIGDFGLSRILPGSQKASSAGVGTPAYRAPEAFRGNYDKRADIWSLGIILYELVAGKLPFSGDDPWQLGISILQDEIIFPAQIPGRMLNILRQTMVRDLEIRYPDLRALINELDFVSLDDASSDEVSDTVEVPRSQPSESAPSPIQAAIVAAREPSVDLDMVFVQGGTFEMGSEDGRGDEKPVHAVHLSDLCLSKYPVTVGQFRQFCEQTGTEMPGQKKWSAEDHPVVGVTWDDAVAFCKWAGGRLPTEAEWEYAARGGQKSLGYKYSGSKNLDEVAWHYGNAGNQTHPVGQKQPNELGLYDMSGNVCEWCADWYDWDYYKESPTKDPQGPSSGKYRVLRGSSLESMSGDYRIADRNWDRPDIQGHNIGFRLARSGG